MSRRRLALALLTPAAVAAAWVAWPLPSGLTDPPRVQATALQDRHGIPLRATRAGDGSRQAWLPLADVDPDVLAAFVALEDRRFFSHHGMDPRAVLRAAWGNLRRGRVVSGASTISMQLARLLVPLPRTWSGKARQALWALRLEAHLSKQEILEQYLNRVPLGEGAVGVPAAADLYFGRPATDLGLGEAALLAGLARLPSANPIRSPQRARERRAAALRALPGHPAAEVARALDEPVLRADRATAFAAPHFTSAVLAAASGAGRRAGGPWRTTLDLPLQREVEAEVRVTVAALAQRGVRQAAVLVLDNRTGGVLAWVGSPDFWAAADGQVDMVVSPRQPGSALKPFLYGLAFDRGATPATILADIARTYRTATGPYAPRNYDRRFHGPVRAREALASSYNVPAVELAERLGPSSLLAALHRAGFRSLGHSAEYYGLGLALGNGDVSLLELANGYRALANGGEWRPVTAGDGIPLVPAEAPRPVMSPLAASLVLHVLADPVARIPGFGVETPFEFPFPAAVKTGTSRHFTDNWAIGVTAGFTVAAWAGNFDGRPMDGVGGITGAGPLLRRAMLLTAARYDPGRLVTPAERGAEPVTICRLSGLRAGPRCPTATEWFPGGAAPAHRCDWHTGEGLRLPAEYGAWAASADRPRLAAARDAPRGDGPSGGLRLVSPRDGDRYRLPPGVDPAYVTVPLRAEGRVVRWEVDGRRVAGARWQVLPGRHRVRAVGAGGAVADAWVEVLP